MPWNDSSGGSGDGKKPGGPWGSGSGPRQPWGSPPPRGPRRPPEGGGDIEDMLRRFRENFRGRFGGGGRNDDGDEPQRPRFNLVGIVVGLGLIVWAASGIFIVDAGERGVVTRFGKFDGDVRGPGLHYHLPYPIESRQVVNFDAQNRMVIPEAREGVETPESLMITGDRNIVDIQFVVLWRLSNAADYAFNVADQEGTIRAVAESAMREIIGTRELQDIITSELGAIEQAAETLIQNNLNAYRMGVQIQAVQLQRSVPPRDVVEAFNDVVSAGQDRQTAINQATRYRNERVPQARGEAARLIEGAIGYRDSVVREAAGEAARFNAVYEQYRRAPRVTRDRLYLETMERVYGRADVIIIDERAGVQPYVPLQELRRTQRKQDAEPAASSPSQPAPPRQGQR